MTSKSEPSRFPRKAERGAVTTLFAVLVAGGVVMGMLALSIDVGAAFLERRQVQNGADAAVLALGEACAKDEAGCADLPQTTLTELANANAIDSDGRTEVLAICGQGAGTEMITEKCMDPGTYAEMAKCLPLPMGYPNPYVEVRTRTESTEADSTILPKYFSQLIVGGGSDVTVEACARAAWGPVGGTRLTMPLVIGLCNWQEATDGGTKFMVSPPYTPGPNPGTSVPSLETKSGVLLAPEDFISPIFGHVNGSETDVHHEKFGCWGDLSAPPSGSYAPGGFGWVETCGDLGSAAPPECEDADPCTAVFSSTGTADSNTGAALPDECKGVLKNYVGTEVDIPVITAVAGNGAGAVYTIEGIASYYLAGYAEMPSGDPKTFDGYKANDSSYKSMTCFDYKSSCVWGWFTAPLRPVGSIAPGGGTPRGPIAVAPAG